MILLLELPGGFAPPPYPLHMDSVLKRVSLRVTSFLFSSLNYRSATYLLLISVLKEGIEPTCNQLRFLLCIRQRRYIRIIININISVTPVLFYSRHLSNPLPCYYRPAHHLSYFEFHLRQC